MPLSCASGSESSAWRWSRTASMSSTSSRSATSSAIRPGSSSSAASTGGRTSTRSPSCSIDIFPKVRAAASRGHAVHRRPPAARLAQDPRCEHGRRAQSSPMCPTFAPSWPRAGMLVVPLRIGGGSRLKILEALAAGTPVVSTRVGAEGLQLTPGRDLIDQRNASRARRQDPGSHSPAGGSSGAGRERPAQRIGSLFVGSRLQRGWRKSGSTRPGGSGPIGV